MARKTVKKKAVKKTAAKKKKMAKKKNPAKKRNLAKKKKTATKKGTALKKTTKRKTAKRREPARTQPKETPAGRKSSKPFEVCNHFGVYLREIFEREHSHNQKAELGQVFEYLLNDLHGAWNMVKLYGKETPLEKLRAESNPFHYDL